MKQLNDNINTGYSVSLMTDVYRPWMVYYVPEKDDVVLIKIEPDNFYSLYHPAEAIRFGAVEDINWSLLVCIGCF